MWPYFTFSHIVSWWHMLVFPTLVCQLIKLYVFYPCSLLQFVQVSQAWDKSFKIRCGWLNWPVSSVPTKTLTRRHTHRHTHKHCVNVCFTACYFSPWLTVAYIWSHRAEYDTLSNFTLHQPLPSDRVGGDRRDRQRRKREGVPLKSWEREMDGRK